MTKPIRRESLAEVTGAISRATNSIMTAVDGDRALLIRVSEAFAKQTPSLLASMREAVEKGDGDSLARTAHTIKGTVSYFTGEPAIGLAVDLEAAAREGDLARAAGLLPRLEKALQALGDRLAAVASGSKG